MDDTAWKWVGGIATVIFTKVLGIFAWIMHRQVKRIDEMEKKTTVHEVEMRFFKEHMEKQVQINEKLGQTLDGVKLDTATIVAKLGNNNG